MDSVISKETSSSSSNFTHNYQVFLSFRGEDTRKTFTDHLYTALVQAGIHTFRDDDEIERGKKLDLELCKAIQQSRIAIIVFSKNYASSTWCLNEVLMILKWTKSGGNEVLPIFYDVNPSDVREQKGSIGEAFAKFEEDFKQNCEIGDDKYNEWAKKLKKWKLALEQVSNITGMVLSNQEDGHEAKFIQRIVNEVERKLNRATLYVPPHLVGTNYQARNIDWWVRDNSSNVQIYVICGMGGIGKSTLAKYVYNQNYHKFEGTCFLASVKEECERSTTGLIKLQRQLLSSILKGKKNVIFNVDEGIIKVNEAICSRRILLVIDDVDKVDQLEALLGTREFYPRKFYPGSKIIVTTRNVSLLMPHEAYQIKVQTLYSDESLELFSWHAFGKEKPEDRYLEQSRSVVDYCGGLPLALKILGSSLAGKSTEVWENTLAKLASIPEVGIQDILKTSFHSLQDDNDKNLFLHITCFFIGHDRDETIDILDACDFYTISGIQNLVDKCIVSIDHNNKFVMHQLLQEMGQHIVYQESPYEPWNRSRLWRAKDSFMVMKQKKGNERNQGLILDMQLYKNDAPGARRERDHTYDELCNSSVIKRRYFNFLSSEPSSDECFECNSFSRMDNLKLLTINYARVTGSCENFPKGLRWLCWHGFSLKSVSKFGLLLRNIVSLDMSYSKLEHFWIENEDLESLKILNLSYSQKLVKISNFRRLPNLKKLILQGCASLVDLCDTIGDLKQLVFLNLKHCKNLKKFPNVGIQNKCLQSLILEGCTNISFESPKVVDESDLVRTLYTFFNPIPRIPERSGHLPHSLVSLTLRNCNLSYDSFPLDWRPALQILDLSENPLASLPPFISNLSKLYSLALNSCQQLQAVLDLPTVEFLYLEDCVVLERVTFRSTSLKPCINVTRCKNLKDIQDTYKMESLEKSVNPKALGILGLDGVKLVRSRALRLQFSTSFIGFIDNVEDKCQVLYEFGIFSTFHRREEIPCWDTNGSYTGSPSSVSFVVDDSHPNRRVSSLNVYCVYTLYSGILYEMAPHISIKISNITKDLSWVYIPILYGLPEGPEDELVWLSHWKFGSQLESGDEIHVSVICYEYMMVIKEVVIKLEWSEEEEIHNDHQSHIRGVINGDLSDYQFMSKGFFLLSNLASLHTLFELYQNSGTMKNFFQRLLGLNVTKEDLWDWYHERAGSGISAIICCTCLEVQEHNNHYRMICRST